MAQAGRDVEKSVLSKALNKVLNDHVFVYGNKTVIFYLHLYFTDSGHYLLPTDDFGKPDLEAAFAQCRNKWEPVVIYTTPPPGRTNFMINWSRPFHPAAVTDDL